MIPESALGAADEQWLNTALERLAVTHDPALRMEIAAHESWLAVRTARRFWDRGEPFDDLTQVAQIGLLKAIDRFSPERGVPFAAFATPTILGELRRHFRDRTWSVHVPRRAKDLRGAVNAMREELTLTLERSPRVDEIADRLNVPVDQVIESLESNLAYRTQQLDARGGSDRSSSDTDFEHVLDREVVIGLLDHLRPRERRILTLRFFEGMSQEQIAQEIGTSQVHVGRLIAASLALLRDHLSENPAATS
ncbi:MAG: sigma-70 family RNA polymerase sigma factor [Actinomycetota bacterium]|nr:sigma-70 family RNA polymerase sigma factor [Actinomycetota bacterium]